MNVRCARLLSLALPFALGCSDSQDAGPNTVVIEDFEGTTSNWTFAGNAVVETDPDTSSHAMHLSLASGTCGVSSGERTVTIPADAGAIRLRLSGAIANDSDNQIWFTLREDAVSVYGLAIPTTPLSTAREENWCIPAGGAGQTVTLSFVLRTQNACMAMDAWVDDIVFTSDATGCTPMAGPT